MLRRFKKKLTEKKMQYQRAKKGYCDNDVYAPYEFIENVFKKILIEYREVAHGYPLNFKNEEEWMKVIDEMIYHLDGMSKANFSLDENNTETAFEHKDKFYDLLKEWHWDLWW